MAAEKRDEKRDDAIARRKKRLSSSKVARNVRRGLIFAFHRRRCP